MKQKKVFIEKIDEAIHSKSFKSCKEKLIKIKKELENSKNEKDTLRVILKLIELMGVLGKAFFGSS